MRAALCRVLQQGDDRRARLAARDEVVAPVRAFRGEALQVLEERRRQLLVSRRACRESLVGVLAPQADERLDQMARDLGLALALGVELSGLFQADLVPLGELAFDRAPNGAPLKLRVELGGGIGTGDRRRLECGPRGLQRIGRGLLTAACGGEQRGAVAEHEPRACADYREEGGGGRERPAASPRRLASRSRRREPAATTASTLRRRKRGARQICVSERGSARASARRAARCAARAEALHDAGFVWEAGCVWAGAGAGASNWRVVL